MMKFTFKRMHELTQWEKSTLRKLTLKSEGMGSGMQSFLKSAKDYPGLRITILAVDNVTAGWSLMTDSRVPYFHLYIHKSHRRRGYGSALYRVSGCEKLMSENRVIVSPWNDESTAFYNSLGAA